MRPIHICAFAHLFSRNPQEIAPMDDNLPVMLAAISAGARWERE